MIIKKPACYSAISSLGFHLVFVLVAGSFWLSQAHTPPVEKSFRLKVVSKPPPQPDVKKSRPIKAVKRRVVPVKKPMPIPKPQRKLETAKIARVQKMVAPSTVPVTEPHASTPLDNLQSSQTKTQRVEAPKESMNAVANMPSPRTFKPTDNAGTSHEKMVRIAQVQKGGTMFDTALSSPRSLKSSGKIKTGTGKATRVARVQESVTLFGTALSSPRSFKPSGNANTGSGKATRVARVLGNGSETLIGNGFSAPRAFQSLLEEIGSKGAVGRKVIRVQKGGALAKPGTMSLYPLKPSGPVGTGMGKDGRLARVDKGLERVHGSPFGPRTIPNIVDSGAARGYLAGIRRQIASAKDYPREAKNAGQEGKVRVRFTIMEDGSVRDLMLVSATPYAILNSEALEMVRRAAPFSHLPDSIGAPFLKVVLPFTFQLN